MKRFILKLIYGRLQFNFKANIIGGDTIISGLFKIYQVIGEKL